MKKTYIFMALFGFLGGVFGSLLVSSTALYAASRDGNYRNVTVYNDQGKRVGFFGPYNQGGGFMFLFNEKGQTEIQMGAYASGAEKGQTLIGMNDRSDHLRFLFRLHGSKDSPTLIMKDSRGQDRIVMGLDGQTEVPYFRYLNSSGVMKDLLR
mgnify:CR=1 FL=1